MWRSTCIGAYGSVFLFAEYLANLAGDDVFHNFHDYWRYSGSPTLNTAEAIYNAVGEDVRAKISAKYAYQLPGGGSEAELFLSKLLLDYYMTQLHFDSEDPEAFRLIEAKQLLYASMYPDRLDVENGGRAVFAVTGGSFTVPSDAKEGMVYIGLDSDYLPVGVVIVP